MDHAGTAGTRALAREAYHVYERREIVNAILYVLRSRCPWRMLSHEFPAWGTVYYYFRKWQHEGIWDQILRTLRMRVRRKQDRDEEPSVAIIDSQSMKTSVVRDPKKGFDMEKKCGAASVTPWRTHKAISWPSR